jgi:hypothetical protein
MSQQKENIPGSEHVQITTQLLFDIKPGVYLLQVNKQNNQALVCPTSITKSSTYLQIFNLHNLTIMRFSSTLAIGAALISSVCGDFHNAGFCVDYKDYVVSTYRTLQPQQSRHWKQELIFHRPNTTMVLRWQHVLRTS